MIYDRALVLRWWRSLESRDQVVLIGAAVAAVATFAAALATGLFGLLSDDDPAPDLEIQSLEVRDEWQRTDGKWVFRPTHQPRVIVTVANRGDARSVVTRVRFTVEAFESFPQCVSAGEIASEPPKNVELPGSPDVGDRVEVDLAKQFAADEAGRLTFRFDLPQRAQEQYSDSGFGLYLLRIELEHDGETATTDDVIAVGVPRSPDRGMADADLGNQVEQFFSAEAAQCVREQQQLLDDWFDEHGDAVQSPMTRHVGRRFADADF